MGLENYSSALIASSSEFELEELLRRFEQQEISIPRIGVFLGYNVLALLGLKKFATWYIRSHWLKRDEPRKLQRSQLSLFNIVKRGSLFGLLLGGVYIAGFLAVGSYAVPISTFKKYCELQEAKNLFTFTYDPFYQEMLLFRKMRKFGLSEQLIREVRDELNCRRDALIESKRVTEETVAELKRAAEAFRINQIS